MRRSVLALAMGMCLVVGAYGQVRGKAFIEIIPGNEFRSERRSFWYVAVLVPQMALWFEADDGTVTTLWATRKSWEDSWMGLPFAGPVHRPAALPVWTGRRHTEGRTGRSTAVSAAPHMAMSASTDHSGAFASDGIAGATPDSGFSIGLPEWLNAARGTIFFEMNKSYDYNDWYSEARLENLALPHERKSFSGQPSLVYALRLNGSLPVQAPLELIGHGQESGADGAIHRDMEHVTSARSIVRSIILRGGKS